MNALIKQPCQSVPATRNFAANSKVFAASKLELITTHPSSRPLGG